MHIIDRNLTSRYYELDTIAETMSKEGDLYEVEFQKFEV